VQSDISSAAERATTATKLQASQLVREGVLLVYNVSISAYGVNGLTVSASERLISRKIQNRAVPSKSLLATEQWSVRPADVICMHGMTCHSSKSCSAPYDMPTTTGNLLALYSQHGNALRAELFPAFEHPIKWPGEESKIFGASKARLYV
jgi:hypothetical protein